MLTDTIFERDENFLKDSKLPRILRPSKDAVYNTSKKNVNEKSNNSDYTVGDIVKTVSENVSYYKIMIYIVFIVGSILLILYLISNTKLSNNKFSTSMKNSLSKNIDINVKKTDFSTLPIVKKYQKLILNHIRFEMEKSTYKEHSTKLFLQTWNSNDSNKLFSGYDWHDDSASLDDMLEECIRLYTLILTHRYKHEITSSIWDKIEETAKTICKAIVIKKYVQAYPWGNNWYAFSISLPKFLIFGSFLYRELYGKPNVELEKWAKVIVPTLVELPHISMGWAREGPNILMMTVPWLGAEILHDRYEQAINSPAFKEKVMPLITGKLTNSGEGFRSDGGFVVHERIPLYGYVYDSFEDTRLLTTLFEIPRQMEILSKVRKLLDNKSREITSKFVPLYNRTPNKIHVPTDYGSYGFDVICSVGIISVKQEKYTLQFRLQRPEFSYVESDQKNNNLSQYAVMAREYYYKDTDPKIWPDLMLYYPGIISLNDTLVIKKSTTSTTENWLPNANSKSIICRINNTIGLYNQYDIPDFKFKVVEMMLITESGYTVLYHVEKNDSSTGSEQNNSQILIAANLGVAEDLKSDDASRGVSVTGTSTKNEHKFKNDTTFIHLSGTQHLNKITKNADGQKLTSLRLELDPTSKNVCFSTFFNNNNISQPVVNVTENAILDTKYKLFFVKKTGLLYLIQHSNNNIASVGGYYENTPTILDYKSQNIKPYLGIHCEIDTSGFFDAQRSVFVDSTLGERSYSIFSNVSSNTDDNILKILNMDIEEGKEKIIKNDDGLF